MNIAALREGGNETRVAITPQAVKHYTKLGFQIIIEQGAGLAAGFHDTLYLDVGAKIDTDRTKIKQTANILLAVNQPSINDLEMLAANSLVIAHIDNEANSDLITWSLEHQITLLSMNLIPRISRAQSMDSLSSQANVAGYRAVLAAVNTYQRVVPMMMTAAGMIQPAKILILGAGVAGLQAIATAKRLGAIVYAFDVRRAAKEQVESLGAEFIEVEQDTDNETQGGYASEVSEEYKKRQAELIDQYAKQADMIITTALIPGRKAPILLQKDTVAQMKPGSVIVDLATSRGGNCELSIADQIVSHQGVTLIGYSNLAGLVPTTASELYANNLVHLITLLAKNPPEIFLNPEDEIIQHAVICSAGRYLPFQQAKESQNA